MTGKVVVLGAEFKNKGAEAMAKTLIDQFDEEEVVIASYFESDLKFTDEFEETVQIIERVQVIELLGKSVLSAARLDLSETKANLQNLTKARHLLSHIREADVVIDLNGYALTSKFGLFSMVFWFEGMMLAKLGRTPFVMFPQSVGPFDDWRGRQLVKNLLPHCEDRYVRGSVSKEYLEEIGITDVTVKPDTAFLFEAKETEQSEDLVNEIGGPFATIVPNARLHERWPEYTGEVVELINHVTGDHDKEVLLLPHEYKADGDFDDRNVIEEIMSQHSGSEAQIHTVSQEFSAEELKSIVGESELLIGSRLHSTVAGTSMEVPTIALGWSRKYYEILEFFDLEEYVWFPEQYDRSSIIDQIDGILEGSSENEEKIKRNIEDVKQHARHPFERVRSKYDI